MSLRNIFYVVKGKGKKTTYKYLLIYLHILKYTNTVAIQMRKKIFQGRKISIIPPDTAQCDAEGLAKQSCVEWTRKWNGEIHNSSIPDKVYLCLHLNNTSTGEAVSVRPPVERKNY